VVYLFLFMCNQPLVSINKLNHYFGKGELRKQVLFNINLEVFPGEILIMTGPSGSGKTTLLSLIGGLRSAQEGSLKVLGQEINAATQKELIHIRRKIGYIFQGHNLLDFMTAEQNVRMSVELHKNSLQEARSKTVAILKLVGLEERINYYPHNLSGGQKQRIAIARALVNHPPLIIADEPTAALDGQTGRNIVELMRNLAKEQKCAILMVTHDSRILEFADRIIHMEDGHLIQ
jgi:putative ABC transport system ATP-binding protein